MQGTLHGVTVVELGQILAAPFAGSIMCDLGAEVIKVERPKTGDDGRNMGPAFRNGDSMNFHIFNRGKKSVELDLKSEAGRAKLDTILARADVLIHNMRPGVPRDLHLDGPTLCARFPRLVYCEISAFGHKGPMSDRPGYEPLIQAYSGLSSINGGPDDPPLRMGASICDQGSGMWAVIGALSVLRQRDQTGVGGIVQTSLFESAMVWASQRSDAYRNQGVLMERHATGHPNFVPYQAFDAADSPMLLCAGNDRLFAKVAAVVGHPEWAADERFSTNRARLTHRNELLPPLADILKSKPRAHWVAAFEAVGVPCSPIHTIPEVMSLPQTRELGVFASVPGEDYTLTGMPISINGERPRLRRGPPRLGEHNAEVLGKDA